MELGWPVGYWSRYSPWCAFGICEFIHLLSLSGNLVSVTVSLHLFHVFTFGYFIGIHGLFLFLVGVCIYMLVSVCLGLLFPAHLGRFPVLHVIVRVWL
ncbi:hypothetical protein BDV40DRAFT_185098 [Aspergillus tamarii]|uniref:Uncharacterized protein n=1 Tax=Aspergillus tamarii TaxID=41984 RepID=A0A5N6USF0_ASPTM|nr:hypothetical protein BDV40DRAFT_185098 [Aspergillus tamarii]